MGRLASFETWAKLVPKRSTGPFIYHSGPKDFKVLELTQEPALQYHCGGSRGPGLLWGRAAPEKFPSARLLAPAVCGPRHLHLVSYLKTPAAEGNQE